MKTVNFITSPLTTGHAVRGVGFYTKRLLEQLKIQAPKFDIKIVEDAKANCDLTHYPFFDLFQPTLPIFSKTKTIVTIHDVIPLEFPDHYPSGLRGRFNLALQKLALNHTQTIITDSKASAKSIQHYLKIPQSRIKVIYLAADEKFKPKKVTKRYNLPEKFILYVGDINWNKNIPNLIKTCEQINYPLVIVGKQAAEIDKMDLNHRELQHLKNLDYKNVTRLGFVSDDDLIDIYNLATVYCQPSFAEGFGLPVLEAMACGTQVAVSKTHSLPEIAGNAAEYFDPHDISGMAKALEKAISNKFDVISQAKKFSWEKTAKETLMVYKLLCP